MYVCNSADAFRFFGVHSLMFSYDDDIKDIPFTEHLKGFVRCKNTLFACGERFIEIEKSKNLNKRISLRISQSNLLFASKAYE